MLSIVGKTLIVAGVLLLAFVGYQLWGTGLEQSRHQDELAEEIGGEMAPGSEAPSIDDLAAELATIDPATAPATLAPAEGQWVGIIEIPKIEVNQIMVEGISKVDLKKGPGHYPGTPLPGQAGNSAIAGHRTTYGAPFHRIDELVPGDEIIVSTAQGRFRYEVQPPPPTGGIERGDGWYSVKPTQTEVLAPSEDNRLTLTACHPKRSAKQRIIVTATLTAEPAVATVGTGEGEVAAPSDDDEAALFSGDPDAKYPALVFGLAAFGVWLVAWLVGRRWNQWASAVVFAVPIVVLIWFCFVYTDRWLPSL